MGEATPAFRAAAGRFVRLKLDTNYEPGRTNAARLESGRTHAARLVVARRTGYLLLLDSQGRETRRWRHPGNDRWAELTAALESTDRERPVGRTGRALVDHLSGHRESALRADAMMAQAESLKGAERVPFLRAALKHPAVQARAIEGLGCIGPVAAPALPSLIELFRDPRAAHRRETAYAMARIDAAGTRVVPVYREVLRRNEPDDITIPLAVVSALGTLAYRSPEGYDLLADLTQAKAIEVRNNARLVLDRIPKRPTR